MLFELCSVSAEDPYWSKTVSIELKKKNKTGLSILIRSLLFENKATRVKGSRNQTILTRERHRWYS